MTSYPRPLFCYNPKPRLVWNEVPDAKFYNFKLLYRENSEEVWSTTEENPECDEQGTCQCDYPSDEQLRPLVRYWFVAQANCGELEKIFEAEVILLNEKEQQACRDMESLLEKYDIEELKVQWSLVQKVFGNHETRDPPLPIITGSHIGSTFQ